MTEKSLDKLNPAPILGLADDAEVAEITSLFTKWFINDEKNNKNKSLSPTKKAKSHALKLNFNSLTLNTKSSAPLTLLKRKSTNPTKSLISVHQNSKNNAGNADIFKFDDLLGLVNDIERDHLLELKKKVNTINVKDEREKKKFKEIIYDHFKSSRGLVKKIKNIRERKRKKRRKRATKVRAQRYNDRYKRGMIAKSRKKRLRRQALHAW